MKLKGIIIVFMFCNLRKFFYWIYFVVFFRKKKKWFIVMTAAQIVEGVQYLYQFPVSTLFFFFFFKNHL
jgi:hypothetical protein